MEKKAVSAATVRRLFAETGLDKVSLRDGPSPKIRLKWQAERPMAVWHGDVCHGPALLIDGKKRPLRIHALLDDASRFVVSLEAHHAEREVDMLGALVRALRKHGKPDALYLDNGSTYRGDTLATGCARLGITLIHARPYDPESRGKMERFWRTLREGCIDFLGSLTSLHDVNVRLLAFLDAHYHKSPHAGLFGQSPQTVFEARMPSVDSLDEKALRDALTVRIRRRVRRDSTVPFEGTYFELPVGHLNGRMVELCRCLVDLTEPPWAELEGKRYKLQPVDAVKNARIKRRWRRPHAELPIPKHSAFDPPKALLEQVTGKKTHLSRGES